MYGYEQLINDASKANEQYSGTSVHERLSSWTNRFPNKFSKKKKVSGDEWCLE
jgi:hypothetical protein